MNSSRRAWLGASISSSLVCVALAAGLLRPGSVRAAARPVTGVLQDLRQASPALSSAVSIKAPEIAEDGANVFIECHCELPQVDALVLFVDRNPQPLVAAFHLAPEVVPALQMRVKVAQTAQVWVVARTQGRFVRAARTVKVSVGGCGVGVN